MDSMNKRHFLRTIKRVVVKVGTNLLATPEGKPDLNNLRQIVYQLAALHLTQGIELVVVTSGAITCGSERLGWIATSVEEKQGAAAVGQILLMQEYSRFFESKGLCVGQILLTNDAFQDTERRGLASRTIQTLIAHRVVPIINENDTVSTDEIKFGDNDNLSALVANLVDADMLVLLTDIDGLFTANPKVDSNAELITMLDSVSNDGSSYINDLSNSRSRGGMQSKLGAAKSVAKNGRVAIIANGRVPNVLTDLVDGRQVGTWIQ